MAFTLIELVVAMAIISIGLVITIPAMQGFTNANRQSAQINKLVSDFSAAKDAAVNGDGLPVTIAATGATWLDGWRITKSDGSILSESPAMNLAGFTLTATAASVTFDPTGNTNSAITLTLCDTNTTIDGIEKQLDITVTGRVHLDAQFDCTP